MPKDKKDTVKGKMTVLQVVDYKDGSILIRKFPENMYVWDVFLKGKFYSSYIVMSPSAGKDSLDEEETSEIIKMLYAGAAATIDYQLGEKLSKTQDQMVRMFEGARKSFEGKPTGGN